MCSLVESCLAKVAIFDERLAADVLTDRSDSGLDAGRPSVDDTLDERRTDRDREKFQRRLAEHQRAGVFPLLQLTRAGAAEAASYFSPRYAADYRRMLRDQFDREGVRIRYSPVGATGRVARATAGPAGAVERGAEATATTFRIDAGGELRAVRLGRGNGQNEALAGRGEEPPEAIDVLIVHEGALDLLTHGPKEADKLWSAEETDLLWNIAPVVVRTSGRGRSTRHFKDYLPFIEFNEVSSAVITARNKYSLVRGLFGTTASEAKPPLPPDQAAPKSESPPSDSEQAKDSSNQGTPQPGYADLFE